MKRVSGLLLLTIFVAFMATSSLALYPNMGFFHNARRTGLACCDRCICTLSLPPQCQCTDVKSYCHAACKNCKCTRSNPPRCRCVDVLEYCHAPCPSDMI